MNNNIENDRDRTIGPGKMYPIDLAPQKITIVKSVSNTDVKMAHLITGQSKTTAGQIITHASSVGLMRPSAQIISPNVASQPQMIVSGTPILQGPQIVSQSSQLIGQNPQILSQSQLINSSGQLLSPGTQIISQGTQLSQVSNTNNAAQTNMQTNIATTLSGAQVLNVGGQLVSGTANLVVSSSVRTLPPSVRVLPPLPHNNTRPAVLSTLNVSSAGSVLVNKSVPSHVPRGLAAGASLAVRPVSPANASSTNQGGAWSSNTRGVRSAVVYGARSGVLRGSSPRTCTTPVTATPLPSSVSAAPQPLVVRPPSPASQTIHSTVVTIPTTGVVLTSNTVISGAVRSLAPRGPTPLPTATPTPVPAANSLMQRPLPLLQRNYQPKVVGVSNVGVSVGVRAPVGNSAPSQLYYEVPRAPHSTHPVHPAPTGSPLALALPHQHQQQHQLLRSLAPFTHNNSTQVTVLNTSQSQPPSDNRTQTTTASNPGLPRPSILRKRDIDGSPLKMANVGAPAIFQRSAASGWEDVPTSGAGGGGEGSGGSTTISASSSPAPDDEPEQTRTENDLSPRKKPRKQMLNNEVRQCDFQQEEPPPTPPGPLPVPVSPAKRPLLSSGYVCGWRATALHFARPGDVRRRDPRAPDILAIAGRRHVLASAEGWKVHHLTAQMDDLVCLEADVGEQLAGVLRSLENAANRGHSAPAAVALQPHAHTLLELVKGNMQRSKIVCEGIQEARADILRVFTHRSIVSDILSRQADKRCFRKHRLQS